MIQQMAELAGLGLQVAHVVAGAGRDVLDAFKAPGLPGKAARAVRRFGLDAVQRAKPVKDLFMSEARGESGNLPMMLQGLRV